MSHPLETKVQTTKTTRTPTVPPNSQHTTPHTSAQMATDRTQRPKTKNSMTNTAAALAPTKPRALKRTHQPSYSRPTGYTVQYGDITYATSPARNAKRVQIRTTPENMKQIRVDARETTRWETTQPNARQRLGTGPEDLSDMTDEQRKWKNVHRGLMAPSGEALQHPAADMLLEFSIKGCPVHTGPKWTTEMLYAALDKGAHPSAMEPEASSQLRAESLEKAAQGFCRLVPWNDVKDDPPANLKFSPIAAIPHKSRAFRMILDLSHGVTVNGEQMPSVNEATDPDIAPAKSMAELGNVLPRIIYAVGTAPEALGPVLFSKLDIKDGYWRMVVPEEDEWNFAYVLPKANPQDLDEPTILVIPSSLQIGWTDSPAFFCAASETARDVADTLGGQPVGSLPEHALEPFTMPSDLPTHPTANPKDAMDADASHSNKFCQLLETFVDDFINVAQTTDEKLLRHRSRALLNAIHQVFPPPAVTGHAGEEPISIKKLLAGDGVWAVRKEILGWVFDGAQRCIQLPEGKVTALLDELHQAAQTPTMP